MRSEEFLGLSKKTGQDKAEKLNMIFRLIRIDGEMFMDYPEDVRQDRVCIEIENGKVVKADIR
jgi:hypothetical protein